MVDVGVIARMGLSAVAAFAATVAVILLLDPLSRRVGLLDHPRGRKDHALPTPVSGGLAIAAGVAVALGVFWPPSAAVIGLGAGALILLAVGVADDLWDLHWSIRIIAQVAAALA